LIVTVKKEWQSNSAPRIQYVPEKSKAAWRGRKANSSCELSGGCPFGPGRER
jgi:hypothetical protein